jgi:8-oxo-dGTP diphosphatase
VKPVVIAAALAVRDGHVLLVGQQGPDDPVLASMLPGGRVEAGENLLEALRREVVEETGLAVVGGPVEAFRVLRQIDGIDYLAITFRCDVDGSLAPDDPDGFVRTAGWVPIEEALRRLGEVAWYDLGPLRRYLAG